MRKRSLPPPAPGTQRDFISASAAVAPEPVTAGSLEVVRYSPEGSVPVAPELSITFSQPRSANFPEKAATNVPVKLNPQPPGKWRGWEQKHSFSNLKANFPMADLYRDCAGRNSCGNGSTLSTENPGVYYPPLTVKASYPPRMARTRVML